MQLVDGAVATATLVERCRGGDAASWAALVDRFGRLVHGIALHEGLCREDAADVAQDVFVQLMEQLDAIEQPDRLAWWLMTVARRHSWRRRERVRTTGPPATEPQQEATTDASDWVERAWVHEAVASLDQPCRALVELLFLDPSEPSYAQVSRRLDMPLGSIGPCRARCLERLRRRLQAGRA